MTNRLVVSDSSSLILATKAAVLQTLCMCFAVQIPEAAFEETVEAGKSAGQPDALRIEEAVETGRIKVAKVAALKDKKIEKWLKELCLGEGEEQALKLCLQVKANLFLVDDRQAINAAKLLEINWSTLPGLIVGLAEKNRLAPEKALDALRVLQEEGRYKLDFILDAFKKIEALKEAKK